MSTSDENKIDELSDDTFEERVLKNDKLVVVDFYATWCGPCKMLAPVFEKTSKNYPSVSFYRINVDENAELISKYEIEGVPTLLFFKNGQKIREEVGYRTQNELDELISKLL